MTRPTPGRKRILYVVVCGSPMARTVGELISLAQRDGWEVCLIATPDGRKFIDVPALAAQTGHPVRSSFKNPGDPDVLPPADAMVVAPATANTVAKLVAGIADTLALGLVIEARGRGLPVVVMPYTNNAMAAYPAFRAGVERLRDWGFTVLSGPDIPLHPPGTAEEHAGGFPWEMALAALRVMTPRNGYEPA
ncbi:MAG TPA: flavoprotein [Micromonosporaceae bacterium]|nr:flavoprotein [Micromonosporaceae bacterium]